ncbi:MAG TPA: chromosomal replication initiator protein DnaA, partial [Longimicrobium sp.]|nr:chromosomal replication initiator protein DnaA [Longimicrobium sp.]
GLAFTRPEDAAAQLAGALKGIENEPVLGAHLQLGGVTQAVAIPLAHHRELLAYAAGLQALQEGADHAARDLLEPLADTEITAGGVTLRPGDLLRALPRRHPLPPAPADPGPTNPTLADTPPANLPPADSRLGDPHRADPTPAVAQEGGVPAGITEVPLAPAHPGVELTVHQLWARIIEEARQVLPEPAYRHWLAPLWALALSADLLVVVTPDPFATEWVEDQYGTLLTTIGERLFGRRFTLSIQSEENVPAALSGLPRTLPLTAADIWSRMLDAARSEIPEQAFRTWLAPTRAVAISNDLLVVSTSNPFAVDWVEDKYGKLLTTISEHLFDRRFTISVQYVPREDAEPSELSPASPHTAADIWSRMLDAARSAMPEQAFRTWLAPTRAVSISNDLLVVSTPNPFAVDWVEDKYGKLLTTMGEDLFGRRFTITLQYSGRDTSLAPRGPVPVLDVPAPTPSAGAMRGSAPEEIFPIVALNPLYTFDRLLVLDSNQTAAAAAHAVAEAPGRLYNPLFIYGGAGLPKTHLMHAIGHAMFARDPSVRVMYLSSERFTNYLMSAIQHGTMAEFRRQYQRCDLLLVDDIQFMGGKERAQEEFFHTFNALHDRQRQIVLTSDRPPSASGLEDRLVNRFECGFVVQISPPSVEDRVALLRRKVREDALQIDDEVLIFIARNRTSSFREIEGALIKLLAYSSLTKRPIDLQLAREALGVGANAQGTVTSRFTPSGVRETVAQEWETTPEVLQAAKGSRELKRPRHAAMYLIKEMFDLSLAEIGRQFGGRSPSTVFRSIAEFKEALIADSALRRQVERVREQMRSR